MRTRGEIGILMFAKLVLVCCYFPWALDADADIGTFWHFTDFHLDATYQIANQNGSWGNYQRDTSMLVASTAIINATEMAEFMQQPDFVIWSGDNAPHNTTLTQDDVLTSIFHLTQWFSTWTESIPVLPVIGAHDLFPVNTISPIIGDKKRQEWCYRLASEPAYWSAWIQEAEMSLNKTNGLPNSKFNETCFLSVLIPKTNQSEGPEILLLGLNSLVWYTENPKLEPSIEDPLNQFQWLTNSLIWARNNKAKAIVVTHLPPGTAELHPRTGQYIHPNYNQRLVLILRTFSDVIITTLAGHEHIDGFRVLLDENYKPIGTVFIGPSVDPIRMSDRGNFNPRIRLYQYNRSTGQLLNYRQFWLNLSQMDPAWNLEYSAREEYRNLPDLSPQSMADLLDLFTAQDDPEGKWTRYWDHQLGHRRHEDKSKFTPNGMCPYAASVCRCEVVCAMRQLDVDGWQQCLREYCERSINPRLPTIWYLSHLVRSKTQVIVLTTVGALCVISFILITAVCIYRKKYPKRRTVGTPQLWIDSRPPL